MADINQQRGHLSSLYRIMPRSMSKAAPFVIGGLAAAAGAGWLWTKRSDSGVLERTRQRLTRSRNAPPNASEIRIERRSS